MGTLTPAGLALIPEDFVVLAWFPAESHACKTVTTPPPPCASGSYSLPQRQRPAVDVQSRRPVPSDEQFAADHYDAAALVLAACFSMFAGASSY